jgi:predicted DNA repair protein MutK
MISAERMKSVRIVPTLLSGLATIGTAAMLWVGGGILLHGVEELGIGGPAPAAIHAFADRLGAAGGVFGGAIAWLVVALAGAVFGLVVGGLIALVAHRLRGRSESPAAD